MSGIVGETTAMYSTLVVGAVSHAARLRRFVHIEFACGIRSARELLQGGGQAKVGSRVWRTALCGWGAL